MFSPGSPGIKLLEKLQQDLQDIKANTVSRADFEQVKGELEDLKANSVSRAEFDELKDKLKQVVGPAKEPKKGKKTKK